MPNPEAADLDLAGRRKKRWVVVALVVLGALVVGSLGLVRHVTTRSTAEGDWLGFVRYPNARPLCSGRVYGVGGEEIHWWSYVTRDEPARVAAFYRLVPPGPGGGGAQLKGPGDTDLDVLPAAPRDYPSCDTTPTPSDRTVILVSRLLRRLTDVAPGDFAVRYEYRSGSLPPPGHFEYSIHIEPDGRGTMVMRPDYPSDRTPTWTETFTVTPDQLATVYRLLYTSNLFVPRPAAGKSEAAPVGGDTEWMTVTAAGATHDVADLVSVGQGPTAARIYEAVNALVPARVRESLLARRERYARDYRRP
jgi:hypothetical protein